MRNCFQHKFTRSTFTSFPNTKYQRSIQKDNSPLLNSTGTKKVRQIVGCLLYYARVLDNTLLVALNTLSQNQATPATNIKQLCTHVKNYCVTYPNVGLRYHATNMILQVDSNASFLIASEAKSRVVAYFCLQNIIRHKRLMHLF